MAIYSLDGTGPRFEGSFSWIAETAVLIGKVEVNEGVGIWFGAVLRGDNENITIGAMTNIQENCIIHTDPGFPVTIGQGCTIGHQAIVHGCTIGDNTLVGMGATVLNGAMIGNNCLIGACALVREGEKIPDNSLVVGAPAKVIRQIDGNGEAMLRRSAEDYAIRARHFAAGLQRISQ
ncbi:gamma carbonic anhydrase family protein [Phyllobacterium sophorae]|uniref:Gamma carbonic anhydrase family protein n=1 Tax=Phyllobacterium sophorae TaxID=1520277 RepID=A0A2P7B706_9HYPH|nr:gamma carbonic anhydrase family protein [Phyllobacterium sophorae]PSH62242.1 gamma carbonic anhydrase family protein [Phyllobacterium sophorae]